MTIIQSTIKAFDKVNKTFWERERKREVHKWYGVYKIICHTPFANTKFHRIQQFFLSTHINKKSLFFAIILKSSNHYSYHQWYLSYLFFILHFCVFYTINSVCHDLIVCLVANCPLGFTLFSIITICSVKLLIIFYIFWMISLVCLVSIRFIFMFFNCLNQHSSLNFYWIY